MFILSDQRNSNVTEAFNAYAQYLNSKREIFPKNAFELATSDWYFNPERSGCPHDAWLESVVIAEPSEGEHHEIRNNTIKIELLAAYHDGIIIFEYTGLIAYKFACSKTADGHGDWLYDQFRISDDGKLLHEIEWEYGNWEIEAADVLYSWKPFAAGREAFHKADLH